MDYGTLLKMIRNEFPSVYGNAAYYNEIATWLDWYKGYVPAIHVQKISNGLNIQERKIYRLKMAKRIAEDWASSLLNEDVKFVVSSDDKSGIFLYGSKGNRGVLGSNNFETVLSNIIEQTFALGTGALVLNISNISVSADGTVVDGSNGKIEIQSYNSTRIIPISSRNGIVTECSFVSEYKVDNRTFYLVSSHILSFNGEYLIKNQAYDSTFKITSLPEGILPLINTRSKLPLFCIFKTNIANNIDLDSPMGLSIYSEALDNLACCDIVYDSCVREVITGQRIVMMNKMLLTVDNDGKPIAPQDVKQTYMQFFGDDATSDINEYIKEFHPSLNTDALDKELQNQLNMLSDKVGLGTGYYKFDGSTVKTATEYIGEHNDFQRNIKKMTLQLTESLQKLATGILFIGKNLLGQNVNDNAKVDVSTTDGFVDSDNTQREQDRKDVEMGIMSKAEYRAKWYGETLETAEAVVSNIAKVNQDTQILDNNL